MGVLMEFDIFGNAIIDSICAQLREQGDNLSISNRVTERCK